MSRQPYRNRYLDALLAVYLAKEDEGREKYGTNFHSAAWLVREHLAGAASRECDHWHDDAGIINHHVGVTWQMENSLRAVDPTTAAHYWDYTREYATGTQWCVCARACIMLRIMLFVSCLRACSAVLTPASFVGEWRAKKICLMSCLLWCVWPARRRKSNMCTRFAHVHRYDSDMFAENAFGSVTTGSDHVIKTGRFAYLPVTVP